VLDDPSLADPELGDLDQDGAERAADAGGRRAAEPALA
jgi:hypothetical protein